MEKENFAKEKSRVSKAGNFYLPKKKERNEREKKFFLNGSVTEIRKK
jgi:hypothetical protein